MASLQAESIANSLAFPMVLKAALELGVIDTISAAGKDTWLSPSEIAVRLPSKPSNPEAPMLLDRMMRQLASHSILKCRVVETGENNRTGKIERVYAAEPVCKFFLKNSDETGSFFSLFMLVQGDIVFKAWTHLKNVILEGRDGFSSAHGMRLFEYIGLDEPYGDLFNRAMSESSIIIMNKVLEVYKGFEDVNILVDVGGGLGTVLGLITSKYPHIEGINFDLPHVLAHAHPYSGIKHVAGDMFTEVPKGDVILMKVSYVYFI
ncbi:unnamed protein product [Microthlaspi erraticum]|uniref:O-methyltransferase domain-containing protein n=1 Tax=Microthlaspi erraticum TaxID=1685480 RepID=A0A6D2HEU2_9BRAS|nr:unnamed protein product [Microthlaspi erraticum]